MSKKIASGAQKIMLEVTYGKGAFMKNIDEYTKENSIENRKRYDEVISMLKEKKVTDENSKRIA